MSDTVVFIPAWNEEASLPAVLGELRDVLPRVDVLVIDDGSTDRTVEVARANGADVVSFGENRGLRVGIAAGYRTALDRGYAFCGRVDADGQHAGRDDRPHGDTRRDDEEHVEANRVVSPQVGRHGGAGQCRLADLALSHGIAYATSATGTRGASAHMSS